MDITEKTETKFHNENAHPESRCTELKNENKLDLKEDCPLADNKSSCDSFCNWDCVTNIRRSKETTKISTNGGVLAVNHMVNFNGCPNMVWFDKRAITNILRFSKLAKTCHITCDNEK